MAPAQQDLTEKKKVFSNITIKLHVSITSHEPIHTAQYLKRMSCLLTTDMFMDNEQQFINATVPFRSMKR